MSQPSQRSSESGRFETLFGLKFGGSSYIDPKMQTAQIPALTSSTVTLTCPTYESVFREAAQNRNGLHTSRKRKNFGILENVNEYRIKGGEEKPQSCKYKPPASLTTECKGKNRALYFIQPRSNVTVINVKLNDSKTNLKRYENVRCQVKQKLKRIKTRGTQTLYRESSAQTLPYLPVVSNDDSVLDNLELFKLPTILPGDGPPGLYEVEVLERARKRWAFTRALKDNFRRQLDECKENVTLAQKRQVIEAFEWEHWMEREEHIQECQMLRLEIVIRMFEKREKQMHDASKSRIELSHAKIAAKREEGLRKNEIEYARQMRCLEMNKRNIPRNWHKDSIISQLGSPSAEFFAPQMRYGVNPNRRHFVADRKTFEMHMIELERKAVNMNKLICPFAKLTNWAKPKSRIMEIEQNFCADSNLKKIYEDLKKLREQRSRHKQVPRCLKEKVEHAEVKSEIYEDIVSSSSVSKESKVADPEGAEDGKAIQLQQRYKKVERPKLRSKQLMQNSRSKELELMLVEYEGTTLGWLMKFLSDEKVRLEEQRKLQFLSMLAQKERWRREAAEAGLRQKENDMRAAYENIYQKTNNTNMEICSEYLANILNIDTKDHAEEKATKSIVELAKLIDSDIQRWLDSLKEVQNPLNYQMLHYLLRDIIFPNVEVLIKRYECELVVDSIINDVLFPQVYKLLEPCDISFAIASDMIDRLIDNDLYLISDDSSVSSSGENTIEESEARAILRKLIRRAVPGRRWMTPSERFGNVCVGDLLDKIFDKIKIEENKAVKECPRNFDLTKQASMLDLVHEEKTESREYESDSVTDRSTALLEAVDISPYGVKADINITRPLQSIVSIEDLALTTSMRAHQLEMLTLHTPTDDSGTDLSIIGIKEDRPKVAKGSEQKGISAPSKEDARIFLNALIQDVIKGLIPHEEGSDERDFFFGEEVEDDYNKDDEYKLFVTEEASADDTDGDFAVWKSPNTFDLTTEAEEEAEREQEFVVYENESETKMLQEKRENYISEMLRRGKARVNIRPRPVTEDDEEEMSNSEFTIGTFENDDLSIEESVKNKDTAHIEEATSQKSVTSKEGLKVTIESQDEDKLKPNTGIDSQETVEIVEEGEQRPIAEEVSTAEYGVEVSETIEVVESANVAAEAPEVAAEPISESVAEPTVEYVAEAGAEPSAEPEAAPEPESEDLGEPAENVEENIENEEE